MRLGFIPRPRLRIPGKGFVRRRFQRRRPLHSDEHPRQPLYRRLANAWYDTPPKWYPLHIGIGSLLLVSLHWRKRRQQTLDEAARASDGEQPVRIKGPWHIHVLGVLPLRSASRLWGYLNSLELPVWIRPFGFTLYSWIFGCNLDELDEPDLTKYASLGEFFYRKLRPDARPIAASLLVSPADGTVLHFGSIQDHKRVEQVKGMTYSLDALLGVSSGSSTPTSEEIHFANRDHAHVDDTDFANVNGIEYSVDELLGASLQQPQTPSESSDSQDASVEKDSASATGINMTESVNIALEAGIRPLAYGTSPQSAVKKVKDGNELFFAVIYLAPGDYHRFHSPAAWVVEKRRHFAGELYSVSPYIAKRLANLFVLNERVALLGRWRHGFFSMVPVGATNVGSILVNFDKDLRTNERRKRPAPGVFREAVYTKASPLLGGQPLKPGVEVGGFKLGSTIVLVFEAPKTFQFSLQAGQKVRVGESMGDVEPPLAHDLV
ncbi:phosphatidylserine decarboxylase 1 [Serendipita sp. 401]|nr:phosphatidylserine decarboxylase 1 [Serendipita sp. 401]KAG9053194.1 phosphatidylserine decarboxylase 1 [Serendipita sp. 407]